MNCPHRTLEEVQTLLSDLKSIYQTLPLHERAAVKQAIHESQNPMELIYAEYGKTNSKRVRRGTLVNV